MTTSNSPIWAENGWLADLEPYISETQGYQPEDFIPTIRQALSWEGNQHAVPFYGESSFLVYRRDLFEEAGLEMPEQPTWDQVREVAELTQAVGGEHIVVIPAMWRDDVTGEAVEDEHLSPSQWERLFEGHNELGAFLQEQYGLKQEFHSHADSHVCDQQQITRFLEGTDPQYVSLCLDTGHAEYGGASSAEIIRTSPERVGYLHLKQIDPKVMETVRRDDLTWAAANRAGVMVEPPGGSPDLNEVIEELEKLNRSFYCIVEQDMYPVQSFEDPLPIASRTRNYLCGCGSRTRIR